MITLTTPVIRVDRFTPTGRPMLVTPAPEFRGERWAELQGSLDINGAEESDWSLTRSGAYRIRSSAALGDVTVQLYAGPVRTWSRSTLIPVLERRNLSEVDAAALVARIGWTR